MLGWRPVFDFLFDEEVMIYNAGKNGDTGRLWPGPFGVGS